MDIQLSQNQTSSMGVDEAPCGTSDFQLDSSSIFGAEGAAESPFLVQQFKPDDDEGFDQLSRPQTNNPAELSIPREIISSSTVQAELLRPLIAGKYGDNPAFLVRIQFQIGTPSDNRGWHTRIQTASINILLEDASYEKTKHAVKYGRPTPSVVKVFPGPKGWKGKPSSAEVTQTQGGGLEVGWDAIGVSANMSTSRTKTEIGAVGITTRCNGQDRNALTLDVDEDPVAKNGTPEYLVVPLIIVHHDRRFSMRVSIHTDFGFRRGKLAEECLRWLPDEPLYFDPVVLRLLMESGKKGISGLKVVEWHGELDNVDLSQHCSFISQADQGCGEGNCGNSATNDEQ